MGPRAELKAVFFWKIDMVFYARNGFLHVLDGTRSVPFGKKSPLNGSKSRFGRGGRGGDL